MLKHEGDVDFMRLSLLLPLLVLLASRACGEGIADQLKWNFQARTRAETRNNTYDFDSSRNSVTDDTFLLMRVRLGVEWQPEDWIKIAVQGQDVREAFSKRVNVPLQNGAEGDDTFDLRLASIELGRAKGLSVKMGRQVLSYGDERLVGPLEWQNFSRTFDAVKLHYQAPTWWLDAFTSSVVRIRRSQFNLSDWVDDAATRNQFFSGLYFSSQFLPFQATDLYAFHLHEETATGTSNFVTLGTRHKGDPTKLKGWDYSVELVGQVGQVSGKSLTAYAYHLEGGYNWLKHPWKPRLALEYSAGSGDSDPNDGQNHTFQNLFPTNHPPYGFMDTFSWQNMQNVVLRMAAQPHPKVKTTLDFHSFWLTTTGDAWYRANGTTRVRAINPNANSHAGCELDFTINAKLTPHLDMLFGYSHFFAGAYLAATGPSDDADFAYWMLTLNY
ncbi:alginate export family protein [Prosthecobacter sp.]|uniref:alginate export family protein n=1 Tax=Prosthecobacter sp. TaxID=1965333 RepID=UPI0037841AD7